MGVYSTESPSRGVGEGVESRGSKLGKNTKIKDSEQKIAYFRTNFAKNCII